jgi:hypothetical protein
MLPAQGVLKQFAAHINGHDDEQSMALLARKYLALHVRVVPTNTAYTYIAGDYDLLTLRVRDPPISVYSSETSPIDVAAVVDIFKRGYLVKQNEKNKTLSAFVASTVSGAQPWKDAAYLYALNVRGSPQFHDLVQTIHREVPVSGRLFSDVYNQVKKYTLPKNEQTAKDMGMLIASLTYPEPVVDDFDTLTPTLTPMAVVTTNPKERALSVKASEATHELATMRAELEPFRKREMISPLRDTLSIAKQFLLSPAASRLESEVPLVAKLLRCSEFCAPLAAALVDAKASSSSSKVRALVEASNRYEWDSASLVERIISPTTTLDARVLKRYQAANVEEEDDVIARCIESCI